MSTQGMSVGQVVGAVIGAIVGSFTPIGPVASASISAQAGNLIGPADDTEKKVAAEDVEERQP